MEKEGIRIVMTAEQKKRIRLLAIEENTTMSDLILQKVLNENSVGKRGRPARQTAEQTEQTAETNSADIERRIKEINETLSKMGSSMTAEQREALKKERAELKTKI